MKKFDDSLENTDEFDRKAHRSERFLPHGAKGKTSDRSGPKGASFGGDVNQKFVSRMARICQVHASKVPAIFGPRTVFSGRINRLKAPNPAAFYAAAQAAGLELSPLEWFPDGFTFTAPKGEVAAHPLFAGGQAFIQNAASFLPVLALEPTANDRLLDACAAPGGKSSLFASLCRGKASLWLNDGIVTRLEAIRDVQTLLGFDIANLTSHPAQFIDREVPETFHKIMLDAQCTGEGMIDLTHPAALDHWAMPRIHKYHHLQTKMLKACFKLLKPGGVLVYSTCTLAPEEDEGPVSKLLRDCPDAAIEPLLFDEPNALPGMLKWDADLFIHPAVRGGLRLLPHGFMEGFYVCRIRKLGDTLSPADLKPLDLKAVGRAVCQG